MHETRARSHSRAHQQPTSRPQRQQPRASSAQRATAKAHQHRHPRSDPRRTGCAREQNQPRAKSPQSTRSQNQASANPSRHRECRLCRRSPSPLPESANQRKVIMRALRADFALPSPRVPAFAGARLTPYRRAGNQSKVIMRAKRADFALPNPAVTCARCEPGKPGGCRAVFGPKPWTDTSSLSDRVGSTWNAQATNRVGFRRVATTWRNATGSSACRAGRADSPGPS